MKEEKGTKVSRRNFLKLSGVTAAGAAGVLGGGLSGILSGPQGREPDAADMAVNYQVHMTNLSKHGNLDTAQLIAVVLSPDLAALPANAALFTVEKNILGKAVGGQIAVVGLELAKGDYSPSWGRHIIIAECLASPK